jgi:hypothetical protein
MANELLEKAFEQEISNPSDVNKELFKSENPEVKTDLSAEQISIITRLGYLGDLIEDDAYKELINKFIILRISKDRKSRGEFVEAQKSSMPENRSSGVWGSIASSFRGR